MSTLYWARNIPSGTGEVMSGCFQQEPRELQRYTHGFHPSKLHARRTDQSTPLSRKSSRIGSRILRRYPERQPSPSPCRKHLARRQWRTNGCFQTVFNSKRIWVCTLTLIPRPSLKRVRTVRPLPFGATRMTSMSLGGTTLVSSL